MGNDTFYKDTFVLTISNLAMAIIRFVFSIILSDKLGPEGVGLYGLIMPIYDLFCCLVCGGIIAAISKEVSSYYGTSHYKNLDKSINVVFTFSLIWSIFVTIIIFILSPIISNYVIKDSRTLYSLWVLCPALIFIAISSVYKGYFYGVMEVKTPAIIDIVEKAIRMFVTLSVINYFLLEDITSTVTSTYASFTIGEFISLILLYLFYKKSIFKFKDMSLKNERVDNSAQLLFNILIVAAPLAINGLLTTAISGFSTLLVPRRLVLAGLDYTTALEIIGKFSGMSLSIIYFPIVIVISMSTVLIPDISKNLTKKDFDGLEIRINEVVKMCFLLGVSTMLICLIMPNNLGMLFYNRTDLSLYIKAASICAPFLYASSCTYGILNGLGKQKTILISSLASSLIQLLLIYILIAMPKINILGYAIALSISSIISLIINMIEINKVVPLSMTLGEFLIIMCLTILTALTLKVLNVIIPNNIFIIKNIILIVIGFSLFITSTFMIRKSS